MESGAADIKSVTTLNKKDSRISLEVGKWYKQRRGKVTKIIGLSGSVHYPFRGSDGETYTEFGIFHSEYMDERDLIKEVPEPVSIRTQIFKFFSNSI